MQSRSQGSRQIDKGVPTAEGAAQAKLLTSDLAGAVAEKGLHLFGAEGLRWHRGLHLLTRRINALQVLYGDKAYCEELLVSIWEGRSGPKPEAGQDQGLSAAMHP